MKDLAHVSWPKFISYLIFQPRQVPFVSVTIEKEFYLEKKKKAKFKPTNFMRKLYWGKSKKNGKHIKRFLNISDNLNYKEEGVSHTHLSIKMSLVCK